MFRVSNTPIIGVHKTITTASGTAATSLQHGQAWPRWMEVAAQKIWPVPEAVVTVLCTPDDGCGWHPKHVEWTCRIINRQLCVASRWTVITSNTAIQSMSLNSSNSGSHGHSRFSSQPCAVSPIHMHLCYQHSDTTRSCSVCCSSSLNCQILPEKA